MDETNSKPNLPVGKYSGIALICLLLGLLLFGFGLTTREPLKWVAAYAIVFGLLVLAKRTRLVRNMLAMLGLSICVCGCLLWLAVVSPNESDSRTQSLGNLKGISQGMLSYDLVRRKLPTIGTDENGVSPNLSWRVHILPFMEKRTLYEKFHLDEPWDSPHNKSLISQMPYDYKLPGGSLAPGKTVYLAVTGSGAAFQNGEKNISLRDFSDELSNTLTIIEADADQAVIWTKPADWQFDPSNPKRGLGNLHPGCFLAAFADGHVRSISINIDDETLKALITRDGGEQISPGDL